MSWWWRTRPDGRRRPSAWLVAAVVLGAAWWLGGERRGEPPAPPVLVRHEPAAVLPAVEPAGPEGGAGWLELLERVLARREAERPAAAVLPPPAAPVPAAVLPVPMLTAWTAAQSAGDGDTAGGGGASAVRGEPGTVLPAGETVRVWFLETVRTSHLPALVRLVVAEDVRFGGRLVWPRGVRLLGSVQGDDGNRLAVVVDTVQWPDGGTSVVAGQVVDAVDGFAGVRAWVVPPPGWVQGLDVAEEAWEAAVGILRARATDGLAVADPWRRTEPDLRETLVAAGARAAVAAGRGRAAEWRRRFPAYLEIRPGTEARVMLLQPYTGRQEDGS